MNRRLLTLAIASFVLGTATQAQLDANATGVAHDGAPVATQVDPSPGPNAIGTAPAAKRGPGSSAPVTNILVYDNNTYHQLALSAAMAIDAGGTVQADATTFDGLLTSMTWDVVAVDCPSTRPSAGWGALINYVNGGGAVVMSFWDWDNNSGYGDPNLCPAFEVSVAADISLSGQTLYDSGTSTVFSGVTMPNNDWHNHWADDGDNFNPLGSAYGLGYLGGASGTPVMVAGNNNTTIALPALDEAGDTWLSDGSGVTLWINLLNLAMGGGGPTSCLVYDNNTYHQLALQAAINVYGAGVVQADATTFDGLLTGGTWDTVLIDCPSTRPSAGWGATINYVNGGGKVVMSFWDWDNNSGYGDPNLCPAFEVQVASDISLTGLTLYDSGTSSVFSGVTMPNSDWHNHWADDGDEFWPLGAAYGLGHVGSTSTPVMVHGNGGATIALFASDDAGDTWIGDGSGVQLWENMIGMLSGCTTPATCTWYCGTGFNIPCDGFVVTGPAILGGSFMASVSGTCPVQSGAFLAAYSSPLSGFFFPWGEVLVNFADPNGELTGFASAFGDPAVFSIPIPMVPAWCGFVFYIQAAGFGTGIVLHCAWQCTVGI